MGLSRGDIELEIVETALNFEQFGKYHCTQVATADDTDFEGRHVVEKVDLVC